VSGPLAGRVVVVVPGADAALALAAEGATVVLLGPATEETGRLVARIEDQGTGRAAVFTGDASGLAEFLTELFGTA
jgi:NAD(P)-dependent dehydrogenase (short-subunit alcohol dehydrogenase family)